MSKNALILYIGEQEAGQAFAAAAEANGHYAYLPENLMQALGMYITYFPEIVIIDMALDYAQEVFQHLQSVDAKPMILLTDKYVRSTEIFTLPSDLSAEALVSALERLDHYKQQKQRVPNGVLRYA